jgi:glycosyltransferase involved in cell wall biosynthesis
MLNFFGVINSLGYGVFTHNLMKAYDQYVSQEIAFFSTPLFNPPMEDPQVKRWVENGKFFKKTDPSILLLQAPYLNQFCGSPMIGFPIFELDQFTEYEVQMLRALDIVFQPSHWGKKVVENHGIKKVYVVPGGYDPKLFQRTLTFEQKLERIQKQGISFIHVGKFEPRKSSEEILCSFLKACEGDIHRVNFCFHVCNPFDTQWFTKIQNYLLSNHFSFNGQHFVRGNTRIMVPNDRFQKEPAKLYQVSDFGIWASKAEGWNLPLLECLACGIPSLTTDNTAQADFIRKNIYPRELLIASHQKEPTHVNGKWWPIDQDELAGKISSMIQNPEKYLRLEDMCYQSVKDFTWENAAKTLGNIMKEIT